MYKLIEITTKTCAVCKMLKPFLGKVLDSLPEGKLQFEVYDAEDEKAKHYVEKYGIKSVPAFFLFKDDEELFAHMGAITIPVLRKTLIDLVK